ncbi:copper resistance protein CopC [Marinicellulosiphila megalodicopiae]|uniref:copper resistance protein CopC n=1 Tax=Marinicellulosiphila megalodicopiae TaxID=2724896 RepID=UPI003BB217DD
MKLQTIVKTTILSTTLALSVNAIASGSHSSGHDMKETMPMKHDAMKNMDHMENMDHSSMKNGMMMKNKVMTMPEDGEMLMGSPQSVMLHFNEAVTIKSITLYNEAEEALDVEFDFSDSPETMFKQDIDTLNAGTYTIKYFYANSSDDLEQGEFWFMVH